MLPHRATPGFWPLAEIHCVFFPVMFVPSVSLPASLMIGFCFGSLPVDKGSHESPSSESDVTESCCCLCRFAGSRGGGTLHPPDSRSAAHIEVFGALAAAAGQGHEPERQLWGDTERDGGLSLDGAACAGRRPVLYSSACAPVTNVQRLN